MSHSFSFRKTAVERLVRRSGYTEAMAQAILDSIFRELTAKKMLSLLDSEIGDARFLDGFRQIGIKKCTASGPGVIFHSFSSNVPSPAILSFVYGMLIGSNNVGRVSSRDAGFLDIYLASLRKHDRKLWGANKLVISKMEAARCLKKADLVVAYGHDETLASLRRITPIKTPFIAYGHKLSLSIFLKDSLTISNVRQMAVATAKDLWMFGRRGCLSPASIYVQEGGKVSATTFAKEIADALHRFPIASGYRVEAEQKILSLKRGKQPNVFARGGWTVVCDTSNKIIPDSPGLVFVKPFKGPEQLLGSLKSLTLYLQAVVLEAPAAARSAFAERLGTRGFNRITRAGKLQFPPLDWHHDGGFNLANWLKWTDLEL